MEVYTKYEKSTVNSIKLIMNFDYNEILFTKIYTNFQSKIFYDLISTEFFID